MFLLVLGNAVFVAAEYALVTGRRRAWRSAPSVAAAARRTALRLMDDPVRFISTVQVGITIFGDPSRRHRRAVAVGAHGAAAVEHRRVPDLVRDPRRTSLSSSASSCPKAVALQKAEPLAVVLAIPLDWLARITYPLVWVLQKSSNVVLRLLRVKPAPAGMIAYTREDIRHSVAAAEDVGELEEAEEEMLYKVFDFASKEVSAVMVPRPEVVGNLGGDATRGGAARRRRLAVHALPVYRGSLDEVVGVLHVRDLFGAMHDLGLASVELESIVRPAYVVPETKDLAALLADFRREKQHMAIVIDEYGDMEGIVTLEDLLEQIVGEIEDEFDLPDTSDRAHRRDAHPHRGDVHDRRLQRGVQTELEQRVQHHGRPRLRRARSRARGRRHGADGRTALKVLEIDGSRIMRIEVEFGAEGEAPTDEPAAA